MRIALTLLLAAVVLFPLMANAIDVSGDQWGTWTKENSPYNVVGEIRVPPESTLVIEPGVLVDFQGHYKFIVDSLATLLAVGTESDSIFFTCDTLANPDRWHGIRFIHADSNSQISYCRLEYGMATGSDEWDRYGGAIFCYFSSPVITYNAICGNWAVFDGGAIFCSYSSPTVGNNTISSNYTSGCGGGINCGFSSPAIDNNTITGNRCHVFGGGICCWYYSPTISNNLISGNFAGAEGGGICCLLNSTPRISNNTINANSAGRGGGIFCYDSSPTVTNTILWGDTAPNGPEIYVSSGNPTVTYCDVQGGWPGEGNIDADPMFVGPHNDDFYLRWHSPCINAGDPSLTDPDGTCSDMGAFYFNLAVLGIVEVYPHYEPIVIPPQGGDIGYDGGVLNLSRGDLTVDIWARAFVPGLSRPQRIWRYSGITIPAGDSLIRPNLSESVPGFAPAGDYTFVTYIGDFPSSIIDSSYLYFSKQEGRYTSDGRYNWQTLKGWFDGDVPSKESGLPSHYALSQNYPNPFNAATSINYQLAADRYVKLEVYNLLGQRVATLVESKEHSGYRSVVWDASTVSSGIYFYKLTAGDYTETRSMMLVK